MAAIAARRTMTSSTWGYSFMILVGSLFAIAGAGMLIAWIRAPIPIDDRIGMYRNNLTKFVSVISFDAGLPRAEVSFQKFELESSGKEFVVAYPEMWNTGKISEIGQETKHWKPAIYMMRRPDIDGYQIAYLKAPDFNAGVLGYSLHTEFDPATKEFFPVFDGRHYGVFFGGILLFACGCFIAFCFYLALYDERRWRWFGDLECKWRNSQLYRILFYDG